MPENTIDDIGAVYDEQIVEIGPGYKFEFCEFKGCEFKGVGPVMFRNCKFLTSNGMIWSISKASFICCDFVASEI